MVVRKYHSNHLQSLLPSHQWPVGGRNFEFVKKKKKKEERKSRKRKKKEKKKEEKGSKGRKKENNYQGNRTTK
jgi:hypothetical protein